MDVIKVNRYTNSLILIFVYFIALKFKLPSMIIVRDSNIRVSKENFCLFLFFKNADLTAITKSSLLSAIDLNIQITW